LNKGPPKFEKEVLHTQLQHSAIREELRQLHTSQMGLFTSFIRAIEAERVRWVYYVAWMGDRINEECS
jgi:hypothetical protein